MSIIFTEYRGIIEVVFADLKKLDGMDKYFFKKLLTFH